MRRKQEIVEFVTGLKNTYHTSDPFKLAEIFGIKVMESDSGAKWFKAHAVKFRGYTPYIVINVKYTESSKIVLCAHELGHIFLHNETVNNFADVGGRINMEAEYEANLFALALLEDQANLRIAMEEIAPYLLQNIVEQSVEKK
ncbi:ImmA/IrrE family metallo-endopeptidase [Butyrivibrio sp. MC2013]|uniref:ImmA/IrrE family metallo-endopeptidase n=1 Tax=Butyrivibrio sp. MC2013 TaxID=1280686 RepID=UPI00040F95F9|nr:ImmA/IrrE family metallo-endopeptidase [Butyrivibrio sp. MC2013]